jgi:hypothetical protein
MKKVKTSDITTAIGMPIKSGTIDHLQSAYTENFVSVLKNIIGKQYSALKVYIVDGLEDTGTGLNFNISAGSIFYQGEIFQVDAAAGTLPAGEYAPMLSITTTYFSGTTADPVTFTDGVPRNVHEIRKGTLTGGSVTLGTANLSYYNFVPLQTRFKSYATGSLPSGLSYFGNATGVLQALSLNFTKVKDLCFVNYSAQVNLTTVPASSTFGFYVPLLNMGLPTPSGIVTIGFTQFGNITPSYVQSLTAGAIATAHVNTVVVDTDTLIANSLGLTLTSLVGTGVRIATGNFFYRCSSL